MQIQHALHMLAHRGDRTFAIFLGIFFAQLESLIQAHAIRHVAADRIVRAGLVGNDVRHHAALREFRNQVGAITHKADGSCFAFAHRILQNAQCFIQRIDHHVAIAGFYAALDAFRVDINSQECCAVHRGGQWLRATHPAHATRHH